MESEGLTIERLGLAPDTLAGEVAVVTGGGRGIGREVVRSLAWLGAKVVIAEISVDGFETERAVIQAGGDARCIQTDISREDEVKRLAEHAQSVYGRVTMVVNNAILCPAVHVLEMDVRTWDQVMGVNLRGAFLTCRAFLPGMIELGHGTIINMISTEAMPLLSAYMASKQGLLAFSQSLAAEVAGKGIRVVAFAPGFVATPGLIAVAERLAPVMGIRTEAFLNMPLHSGYAGSMPAADAGAATAYLAAALADVYHGESTNGFTVLERAGFLKTAGSNTCEQAGAGLGKPIKENGQDLFTQGAQAGNQLIRVLGETAANFERFPIFIRPFARNGFKTKAELNLQDWQHTAQRWAELFQKAAKGDLAAVEILSQGEALAAGLLQKLRTYFWGEPAEAARFTKDEQFLREARRISEERIGVVDTLISVFENIRK